MRRRWSASRSGVRELSDMWLSPPPAADDVVGAPGRRYPAQITITDARTECQLSGRWSKPVRQVAMCEGALLRLRPAGERSPELCGQAESANVGSRSGYVRAGSGERACAVEARRARLTARY